MPQSSAPPRPPFWAASIAVHVAAAIALVVWGAGAAADVAPIRPVEISADVDYVDDEEPIEREPMEEPADSSVRFAESPFGEPARSDGDDLELDEERPSDYILPRRPVPPLEWCREAVIRPLPQRDEPTPAPAIEPPAETVEAPPAPVTPKRPVGVTTSARPDANRSPAPVYPTRARRRGLEGRVVLIVEIDERGRPTAISVSKSSGHSILDRAATEALWKWRFIPARKDGVAVVSTRHQSFRFQVR